MTNSCGSLAAVSCGGPRGGPSRNCGNCRAVKRRCDRQLPHCGQCIRQRQKCPGYRDEWELVFRDQTAVTIKHSKAKRTQRAKKGDTRRLSPLSVATVAPSTDDVGVNYFLHTFIYGNQPSRRGCLDYIPSVYCSDAEHPTLVTSMAAIGLIALANSTQQSELARYAKVKYGNAIRSVNAALASPFESSKDSTLMSVISLGVFEQLSGHRSWTLHVEGAAALVVARGKKQFTQPMSVKLFNQVRSDLVHCYMHDMRPIPQSILDLQEEAGKYVDGGNMTWPLGVLSTRCANLLDRVMRHLDADRPFLARAIEDATGLAEDCEGYVGALWKLEPYTTIRHAHWNPDEIYHGRHDVYIDFWSIRLWNSSRSMRLVLYHMLHFLLDRLITLAGDTDTLPNTLDQMEAQKTLVMETMARIIYEVLASVPQALEHLSSASEPRGTFGSSFNGNMSGGYMLTWSLFLAGRNPACSKEIREWVMQHLRGIQRVTGSALFSRIFEDLESIT